MLHVWHFVGLKTLNTLVKTTSPHSIVTKKMHKKVSSVHGSSVLTVRMKAKTAQTGWFFFFCSRVFFSLLAFILNYSCYTLLCYTTYCTTSIYSSLYNWQWMMFHPKHDLIKYKLQKHRASQKFLPTTNSLKSLKEYNQHAFNKSGYNNNFTYRKTLPETKNRENRPRNITWCNHPYS